MADQHRKLQAVVFDLDDTLYPERDCLRSGYYAVASFLREDRGGSERYEDWLWGRFQAGESQGAFDALNEHFTLGLGREEILRLVEKYRRHTPTIQPYADVPDLLRNLRGRLKLGLLSDGFLPAQRFKLDALKLEGLFDAVVFTEDLGREKWKPSRAGYEEIRRMLSVPHEACAYVGDNPTKDFIAANALGWLTVQFRRDGQIYADKPNPPGGGPQVIIRSADELLAALD